MWRRTRIELKSRLKLCIFLLRPYDSIVIPFDPFSERTNKHRRRRERILEDFGNNSGSLDLTLYVILESAVEAEGSEVTFTFEVEQPTSYPDITLVNSLLWYYFYAESSDIIMQRVVNTAQFNVGVFESLPGR